MAAFVYPGIGLMLLAQVGGVSFSGVSASAHDTDGRAFVMTGADPSTDQWETAIGHVSLDATDRVQVPNATFGDQGTLHAQVTSPGGDVWTVDLTRPGFPVSANGQVSPVRSWVHFPVGGGVLTQTDLQGYTGVGLLSGPLVRGAVAMWGEATVRVNGQVITDHALVEVDALSAGDHADDATFRTLRQARLGDAEIIVFATGLPQDRVPAGFVLFGFDDVQISVGGQAVASEISVPNEAGMGATALTSTGPVSPSAPILGVGGSGTAGTGTETTVPPGAVNGSGFSSSGIPATPPVLNNGSTATPLPQTPTPANAAPATTLPQTPTPGNAAPATPLPGATPSGPTLTAPVPGATGTSVTGTPTGTGTTGSGVSGVTGTGLPAGTTGATGTGTTGVAGTGITGTGTGATGTGAPGTGTTGTGTTPAPTGTPIGVPSPSAAPGH